MCIKMCLLLSYVCKGVCIVQLSAVEICVACWYAMAATNGSWLMGTPPLEQQCLTIETASSSNCSTLCMPTVVCQVYPECFHVGAY